MLGIPTLFTILDRTLDRLAASPNDALRDIGQVMKDNPSYAYLGALGPALGDFIPSDPDPIFSVWGTKYLDAWKNIFLLIGGDGASDPGIFALVEQVTATLDRLQAIALAEDLEALKAIKDDADVIRELLGTLDRSINNIYFLAGDIADSIKIGMRPVVDVPVGDEVRPPEEWEVRDFLAWKRPGRFVQALIAQAQAKGDGRFLAYAYGYLVSYAGHVCGSSFVNSIVLGPYRTQWWRSRWINNYVDAWVYGFYQSGATMDGDEPAPPYKDWPSLCNAGLQNKIGLPGIDPVDLMTRLREKSPFAQVLPPEFGEFWFDAFVDAYGPPPVGSRVKAEALNGAYLMTWLVLWVQTSGTGIVCVPSVKPPPDECDEEPQWVKDAVSGSSGSAPQPPVPETDPDVSKTASGVIEVLIGLAAFFSGGALAGYYIITEGINDIIDGVFAIKWAKFRCDLYWYRVFFERSLALVHDAGSWAGFVHPYAKELKSDTSYDPIFGEPFDSGRRLVKSRRRENRYPAKPWEAMDTDWTKEPTVFEEPYTFAYVTDTYPSFFIDDAIANPLTNGEVRVGGTWPPGFAIDPDRGFPVQFGNAVDNALDLFLNLDSIFPNWNLDADRGRAWLTWQFSDDIYQDPVQVEPES